MAAALGEELRLLKEQMDQGLLSKELYDNCAAAAVGRYNSAPAAPAAPVDRYDRYDNPPVDTGSSYSPYESRESRGSKGHGRKGLIPQSTLVSAGGRKGGGGGRKGGKSVKGEPNHPVFKQTSTKSLKPFDPTAERSHLYSSPEGLQLAERLAKVVESYGGDMLLAVAIGDICVQSEERRQYENIIGNLCPQVCLLLSYHNLLVKKKREEKGGKKKHQTGVHGVYQPNW